MPRFTPEKEQQILEAYARNPVFAKAARDQGVDQKAVKSVVERYRKTGKAVNIGEHLGENEAHRVEARIGLTSDQLKKMYKLFLMGKRLAELVAEDGFDPTAVQNEYDRFLKFEGIDPHTMQKKVVTSIRMYASALARNKELRDRFELIEYKFNNNNYLSAREFEGLVLISEKLNRNIGINSLRIPSTPAPVGWTRPLCSICGKALPAGVFDPNDPLGLKVLEFCRSWTHIGCQSDRNNM